MPSQYDHLLTILFQLMKKKYPKNPFKWIARLLSSQASHTVQHYVYFKHNLGNSSYKWFHLSNLNTMHSHILIQNEMKSR